MGSASEDVLSHRESEPAQEAETLEPKGTGEDTGSPRTDPSASSPNPVDSVTLRVRAMERGNGVTPQEPSVLE